MKRGDGIMKKVFIPAALLFAFCLAAGIFAASWAKGEPLKIFVGNAPSTLKPVTVDGKMYLPLYFPVEKGTKNWEVSVSYDPATRTVKVDRKVAGPNLRGDHKCERCNGDGKCQACYPAGSKKNIQGEECPVCNGTGKCTMCNGEGSY